MNTSGGAGSAGGSGSAAAPLRAVRFGVPRELMIWTETLSVDNGHLDSQHKALFDQINAFFAMRGRTVDPAELDRMISLLEVTLTRHFKDEEDYLAQRNYPDLDQHRQEHRRLLDDFRVLRSDLAHRSGWGIKSDFSWPIVQFMLQVTVGHILKSDIEYRDAIRG